MSFKISWALYAKRLIISLLSCIIWILLTLLDENQTTLVSEPGKEIHTTPTATLETPSKAKENPKNHEVSQSGNFQIALLSRILK